MDECEHLGLEPKDEEERKAITRAFWYWYGYLSAGERNPLTREDCNKNRIRNRVRQSKDWFKNRLEVEVRGLE